MDLIDKLYRDLESGNELLDFKDFIYLLSSQEGRYLLRNDILLEFQKFCDGSGKFCDFREGSAILRFLSRVPEMIVQNESLVMMYRYAIARYRFLRFHSSGDTWEEINVSEYLSLRDIYVSGIPTDEKPLKIDFMPFYDLSPAIKDSKSLGNGMRYLNRYLSSSIFQNPQVWNDKIFDFLKLHKVEEKQLLVAPDVFRDFNSFKNELEDIIAALGKMDHDGPAESVVPVMKRHGFEPGWGNTVKRIGETMQLLLDLINEPDDTLLEQFISRIPMITRIAVISPHGWFGQEHVLGRPDTGGQVIYILDQVRALEQRLIEELKVSGINVRPKILVVTRLIPRAGNTTCNIRLEKIFNSENCYILRVPFYDKSRAVIEHWISRFHVWHYLDAFALDSFHELKSEFQGKPDLIIGNYSDGNLVASLLSDMFNVTQCTIAHALEKTKYLFSDLYWKDMEHDYNFSLQFTADMLAMNKSDFIVTSTYQEIAGTEETMGQYESYQYFSLPGLYQVLGGVNLFHPKFNVIPPGVNPEIYFPFTETDMRIETRVKYLEERLFGAAEDDVFGTLEYPSKMPLFTMARLDRIKNITGLIEAFGMSSYLQDKCNLVFAAGTIHGDRSDDEEERGQISRAYELISRYNLEGKVRWLPGIGKADTGEVYRIIAERRGIFVQPALFEAFGLTVLEAMVSGLPTVATGFGGPSEIIKHGESGFLFNPSKPEIMAQGLEQIIQLLLDEPSVWDTVSRNGINRVNENFNWVLYSTRLINLTKLYGFWRYSVWEQNRSKLYRYCDLIYHFLFRERAL